ncbi:uncharacterized protein LOC132031588 [Lycium ferocissimum]|uniref:uncharacterized protein LOC132031588 n=1 Tax=Lycium ferocissimum TaxID=112874 RepID=UPI0028169960|nr:uncharacterized protein LOC132031588 [Lycium ferocissimum]
MNKGFRPDRSSSKNHFQPYPSPEAAGGGQGYRSLKILNANKKKYQDNGLQTFRGGGGQYAQQRHLREFLSERARNSYVRARPAEVTITPDAPPHVINMIFGGSMIAGNSFTAFKKMKISVTLENRTRELLDEGTITFSNEDTTCVTLSHNDALVIAVFIECFQVKRVMVDPGSPANIIHWKVVEEMRLLEKIIPAARTLAGFNMSSETTKGEIDLPMEAGGVVKAKKFYVIDSNMRYNVIFACSWLHDM